MTYRTESLYLCLDIPTLKNADFPELEEINALKVIVDYIRPLVKSRKAECDDYFEAVLIAKDHVKEDAVMQIDNASRGCSIALRILNKEIELRKSSTIVAKTIITHCEPLNAHATVMGSQHFCFNSLGLNRIQEKALGWLAGISKLVRTEKVLKVLADSAIDELWGREEW